MSKKFTYGAKPLKKDLRDRLYHRHVLLGATGAESIPSTPYRASGTVSDRDQGTSNFCTNYGVVAMAEREDSEAYSREYNAKCESEMLGYDMASQGCDMRTALSVPVKYGLLLQNLAPFSWKDKGDQFAADPTNWPGISDTQAAPYKHPAFTWIVPNNGMDYFDACRSVLFDKRPNGSLVTATPWFASWENPPTNGILPMPLPGEQPSGWHCSEEFGQDIVDGQLVIVDNSWQGENFGVRGEVYFTRAVFNYAMSFQGAAAGTLDKIDPDAISPVQKKVLGLLQQVLVLLQKMLGIIKAQNQ